MGCGCSTDHQEKVQASQKKVGFVFVQSREPPSSQNSLFPQEREERLLLRLAACWLLPFLLFFLPIVNPVHRPSPKLAHPFPTAKAAAERRLVWSVYQICCYNPNKGSFEREREREGGHLAFVLPCCKAIRVRTVYGKHFLPLKQLLFCIWINLGLLSLSFSLPPFPSLSLSHFFSFLCVMGINLI